MTMQTSIYYEKNDQYIFDKVEEIAKRERRSKSATVLAILEEYLEAGRRLGEVLKDMQAISEAELRESLSIQQERGDGELLGRIMVERKYIDEVQLHRALGLQKTLNDGGAHDPPYHK